MSIRTVLLTVALGIGAGMLPNLGGASTAVQVEVAPPPPRAEAVPEARAGYVWVPGYWGWSGSKHEWVNGQFVAERRGHHWVMAKWEHRGPHWYFEDGRW